MKLSFKHEGKKRRSHTQKLKELITNSHSLTRNVRRKIRKKTPVRNLRLHEERGSGEGMNEGKNG